MKTLLILIGVLSFSSCTEPIEPISRKDECVKENELKIEEYKNNILNIDKEMELVYLDYITDNPVIESSLKMIEWHKERILFHESINDTTSSIYLDLKDGITQYEQRIEDAKQRGVVYTADIKKITLDHYNRNILLYEDNIQFCKDFVEDYLY